MLIQDFENTLQVYGFDNLLSRDCFVLTVTKDFIPLETEINFSFAFKCGALAVTHTSLERVVHAFRHADIHDHYVISCPIPKYLQCSNDVKIVELTLYISTRIIISIAKRIGPLHNPYRAQEQTQVVIPVNEKTISETVKNLFLKKSQHDQQQGARVEKTTTVTEMEDMLEDAAKNQSIYDALPDVPVGILWMDETAWNKMNKQPDARFDTTFVQLPKDLNLAFIKARIALAALKRHDETAGYIGFPHSQERNVNYSIPELFSDSISQPELVEYVKRSITAWSLAHEPPIPTVQHHILGLYDVTVIEVAPNPPPHPAFDMLRYAPLAKYYGLKPASSYYEAKTITFCDGHVCKYVLYDINGEVQEESGLVIYPTQELNDLKEILDTLSERQVRHERLNNFSTDQTEMLKDILYSTMATILRKLPITVTFTAHLERIIQHHMFKNPRVIYSGPWASSTNRDEKITTDVLRHYFEKPFIPTDLPGIPLLSSSGDDDH